MEKSDKKLNQIYIDLYHKLYKTISTSLSTKVNIPNIKEILNLCKRVDNNILITIVKDYRIKIKQYND